MEFDLARSLGIDGEHIVYNGPCKSVQSIQNAIECKALVNIDSIQDYRCIKAIAMEKHKKEIVVGIRCNFLIEQRERSRFGLDVDSQDFHEVVDGIRSTGNLMLGGLHCHFPDRDLESFRLRSLGLLEVARRLFPKAPGYLDIGGGFFGELPLALLSLYKIPPPTFAEYAAVAGSIFAKAYGDIESPPTLFIEPGTALVANTFRFYTRVLNIRNAGSKNIATVAGSIQNISPHAKSMHLPVRVLRNDFSSGTLECEQEFDIGGYTCMESDYLTKGMRTALKVGDVIEYSNVGSYSIVMKPPFILPSVPILMLSEPDRSIRVIKHKEEAKDLLQRFVTSDF
jgi:diaminopimelate decarboxylase